MEHSSDTCQCVGRICIKCGNIKCYGAFNRNAKSKDGMHSYCQLCQSEVYKAWREQNAEHDKQRQAQYRQDHLEQLREKGRLKQKERVKTEHFQAVRRDYYQRNAEQLKAKRKVYYQAHRERASARFKEWRKRNSEYNHQRQQRYYANNLESLKEKYRKWIQAHPGYRAVREHERRSRKKMIAGTHTWAQIQALLKRQKYKCYYCSDKFEKRNGKYVYQIEHTFPLSRVIGSNIPANDISYIVLACPHCNLSKKDRFPWEWPEGGRLL